MKISVVIPCRNEVQYIGECIQAIQNFEITSDIKLSVIVVDGMSDDVTREELDRLQTIYTSWNVVDNNSTINVYCLQFRHSLLSLRFFIDYLRKTYYYDLFIF